MQQKKIHHIMASAILALTFTACSSGGGGDSSSTPSTQTPTTTLSTDSKSVAVRSQAVSAGDIITDPFVTDTCGDLGGIAVYSGIDSNNDSVLSIDEQNPTPQVVCNGATGTTPIFNVEQLLIGDANCPSGGIKVTLNTDVSYLCNAPIDETSQVTTTDFTKTGTITGTLPSTLQASPQRAPSRASGLSGVGSINTIISGLFVTPNETNTAVDKDIEAPSVDSTQPIPTPVITPISVTVDANNSYEVPDLPSGEYSLIYVDGDTQEGTKIDNIIVQPDEVKVVDITQTTPNANVILNVKSLTLGSNLENVTVHLNELNQDAITDENGTAGFSNFPEGTYSLTISNEGYVSKYITFNVTSGQTTDLQTIEINSQKGQLVGSVSADEVDDLANIVVYAKSADGSIFATLTDSNGNYTFNALPVGEGYSVLAQAHDFQSSKVDNIEIVNAQTSSASNISLTKYVSLVGSISGFVRFSDQEDSLNNEGIIVSIEGSDYEAITARDGSFILNNIPTGRYTLNFTDSNYDTTTIAAVKVISGTTTTLLDVDMSRVKGNISGTVTLDSKSDHSGIKVTILGTEFSTFTDSVGAWSMSLPIGNYQGLNYEKLLFSQVNTISTITVVKNGLYSTASEGLVQIAQNITGTLTVSGQTDFSDANVSLTGTTGAATGTTAELNVNADGSFLISTLPLGDYVVTMRYPDGLHENVINTYTLDGSVEELSLGTTNLRTSYVKINNDEAYSTSTSITLSLGNSDAAFIEIVENGTTSTKEAYSSTENFTLSSGDGVKTVTINFYDANDNPLPSISDTIILDTTLNVLGFDLIGAATKGDIVTLVLNLGEIGAQVIASIPTLIENLFLLDNGTGGDTVANDGIYERDFLITSPEELNVTATAIITDIAGNTLESNSTNNLVLSTAPAIQNLVITSNILAATMDISFTTDETTTSKVHYGNTSDNLSTTVVVSSSLSNNHSITLSSLTVNALTYFQIEVKDAALNTTTLNSQSKLAPPAPATLNAQAGDAEVGIVWSKVTTVGVIGYNIYRSSNTSAFIKINTTVITDIYFLDATVANDTEYSYKITAVDDNSNESEQSSTTTAIPSASLAGPTEIAGGVIATDTIWLSSRSPYNITADMKVNEGSTLLLLAGTQVNLSGDNRLVLIDGSLEGYGSQDNNVVLNAIDYVDTTDTMPDKYAPYINVSSSGKFLLSFASIVKVDLERSGEINLNNVSVILDTSKVNYNFNVSNFINSKLTDIKSFSSSSEIKFNTAKDSVFEYAGDNILEDGTNYFFSQGINIQAMNFIDSNLSNGSLSFFSTSSVEAIIQGSTLENVALNLGYNAGSNAKASLNTMKNMTITSEQNIYLKYNSLENIISFTLSSWDVTSTKLEISHNYWGTTNLTDITTLTSYEPGENNKLYPIISTADLFNADFDTDGTPDYMDSDNDNDGYSDLQEDKESDPQFGSIYNPLDANSHPSSALDNDYDGIVDDDDTDDDNDGLSDIDEVNYQTNPMIEDSDGDGVSDGVEIRYNYDPVDNNNYPIKGNKSGIAIDGLNINTDGVVYLLSDNSDVDFTNITIAPGTKITIERDTQVTLKDSIITGTKINPVVFRSNGAGVGRLILDNTNMSYSNIDLNIGMYIQNHSKVEFSDIKFSSGGVTSESLISNSYINANNWNNEGVLKNSYISGYYLLNSNGATIESSYLIDIYSTSFSNYALFKTSFIEGIYMGGDYSVENSLINSLSISADNGMVINSDIKFSSGGTNVFFDGTYIGNDGSESFYSGLGSPEDQIGDGVAETVFDINGTTYTVDGITNPRSTKNFPDWVNDPAVKQYFWDPTNVGCLWDMNNPDIFPEP